MNTEKMKLSSRRGFTLLELTIVVAVVGVMASIAIWRMRESKPHWETRTAAKEFAKHIDLMRMLALRSNKEARLCLIDYDTSPSDLTANAGEYTLQLGNKSLNSDEWDYLPDDLFDDDSDDDQLNGTVDLSNASGEYYRQNVSIGDWQNSQTIGGPYVNNTDCIVFSPRGFVMNPASDFNTQGFIEITFINKHARNESRVDDYIVMIARSGMTRIDTLAGRKYDDAFGGTEYDAYE